MLQNLATSIEQSLKNYADKPAYSCLGQTFSFAEIDQKSQALAYWLQQQPGLEQGDRIVIQLPNLTQFPIAAFAALRAGLVIVNTNPLYTTREMLHQFNDSGAKAIIILEDLLPKLNEIIDETQINTVICTKVTDLLTQAIGETPDNTTCLNQIIAENMNKPLEPRKSLSEDDICVLQYTGGTTGVSKGASLSHKNLLSNSEQIFQRLSNSINDGEEIVVAPLPLYHIYAFMLNLILFVQHGGMSILIPNPRDMDGFIKEISKHKFTTMSGLNTIFVGLCHNETFRNLDFSSYKLTISGGTALTSNAIELWKEVTNCSISEGYGLSETSPVLCLNEPGNEVYGSVGKPVFDTEIQLWDDNDEECDHGQIVARGPQVMQGYWNMPEQTDEVIKNGFFKTGDVGIRLENGEIKIVDRLKDMILVSGFNVYPNEIEDVLTQHPSILEAAVIGEPCEKSGEKVCAYITLTGDNVLDSADVVAHCKKLLTGYKVPHKVVFMDELPKSTVGKILRRELRTA